MVGFPIDPKLGILSGPAIAQRIYYTGNAEQPTPPLNTTHINFTCKDESLSVQEDAYSDTGDALGHTATPKVERSSLGHMEATSLPHVNADPATSPAARSPFCAQAKSFKSGIASLPWKYRKRRRRSPFSPMSRSNRAFLYVLHPSNPLNGPSFTMSTHASFTPESHSLSYRQQGESNNGLAPPIFDHYAPSSALTTGPHTPHQTQINPYAQDNTTQSGTSYYQESSYTQPLQYHLYTALGPRREAMHPHQRNAQDFFISDTLREDLQRKSAAAHQVLSRKHEESCVRYQVDEYRQ